MNGRLPGLSRVLWLAVLSSALGVQTVRAAGGVEGWRAPRPRTKPVTTEMSTTTASSAEEAPVEVARKALQGWWKFPWYDAQTDDLRRIELRDQGVDPPNVKGPLHWNLSWLKWLAWFALAACLSALAYVCIRTLLGAKSPTRSDNTAPIGAAVSTEALPFLNSRPQTDLLSAARHYYEQGNFGEAIIFLFSYQLVEMDARQIIRLAKGKTNRQYLREAMALEPLGRLFTATMVAFEEVFFGDRKLDRAAFETYWSRLPEFEALIARGTP